SLLRRLRRSDWLTARRAELRLRRHRRAACLTRQDRGRSGGRPSTVRAEVRSTHDWRSARTPGRRRGSPRGNGGGKERVQLAQPLVERDQFITALEQEVLSELVAAVHLQHEAAEVAQPVLASGKDAPASWSE